MSLLAVLCLYLLLASSALADQTQIPITSSGDYSMETAAWVQAGAAVVMALVTIALAALTACYVRLTHNLVKTQVDPVVDLGINRDGQDLVIHNSGAFQVLDILVDKISVSFLGPPWNKPVSKVRPGPKIPGADPKAWWYLTKLSPGGVKSHPIGDVVDEANRLTTSMESAKARGHIRHVSPTDKVQLFTFVVFHLTFHRDFDRKRYTSQKVIHISTDSNTGKPLVTDAEYFGRTLWGEMVEQLSERK